MPLPELKADTRKSSEFVAVRNLGYAVSVRRAPAAAVSATPPASPISSTMTSEDVHRPRSSALARIHTLVTSLGPHHGRRLQPGCDAAWYRGEEIGYHDGRGNRQEDCDDRDDGIGNDTQAAREHGPPQPSCHDTEWQAHHQG